MSSLGSQKASYGSDICNSPEVPILTVIKKVKLEQCNSSEKLQKPISSNDVPSTVFRHKAITWRNNIQMSKFPSSAVKVTNTKSFSTVSADIEIQNTQVANEYSPIDACMKTQEAQDSRQSSNTSKEKIEKIESGNETIACVADSTSADDSRTRDECSYKDNVEAMDSQNEENNQQIGTEENSACDDWKQLPFFASEMDKSDEIDGGKSRVDEKRSKENTAATKNGGSKRVSERKRQKKSWKKTEKEAKPKKPPPNAFVAIRIPSPAISAKFQEVQGVLQEKDERLKQVFVPPTKNHITLMVMRLNNPEEVERYT